jgi:hypothetical protein
MHVGWCTREERESADGEQSGVDGRIITTVKVDIPQHDEVAPQNSGVPIRRIRFSYDGTGEMVFVKSGVKQETEFGSDSFSGSIGNAQSCE